MEDNVLIPPKMKTKALPVISDSSTFVQEDDLYRLCQQRLVSLGISVDEQDTDIAQIYQDYVLKFLDISTSCSLSSKTILTEEEVILGIIAAKTSNLKTRRLKTAKMRFAVISF